ncbi:plasmid replication initiator RepA [Phaeobacter gallaeciensis]|uniref:Plasmid replication initiator RepA n=2 Tax=Roseobacteraceae TaxID=2854170 RepID=A0A366WKH9_9RHOB|nr:MULTISPECIES: replication initiator protein A [Roseobacteraceae]MBT3141754.1 replication initiator protein A [Falsiruegeria litorea]MBT8167130.1 replication initiator protein A [Falsiruegeria litorea]RBW50314.1 plasmid replication initiator RepA [Phaeobacter gallaeciensis]
MSSAVTGAGGLLPDRHKQSDFFLCDIFDAIPKDDIASMEHPLFSLATRPDRRILQYDHNGTEITVTPSVRGLATIHDKDILLFCISQLMAGINAGRTVSRTLHLKAHDLLVATNRETSGDSYRRLREAFERLAGTRITTNIVTGDKEVTTGFGLIESWQIERKTRGGRMVSVAVTLSEWLFRAVVSKSVLTLSRDYFRLRKPLERRIYELARKHCGRQPAWTVSVDTLLKKSGSASPRRVFRKMLRDMIEANHLPDYEIEEVPGDLMRFTPRGGLVSVDVPPPILSADALEEARRLMPGTDVYALEADWRGVWARTGAQRLRKPDAAFLGWVKKRKG